MIHPLKNVATLSKKPSLFYFLFLFIILIPNPAFPENAYRFFRMWPSLQQPWYFNYPEDISIDGNGYVYVADTKNHRIIKLTADGHLVSQWDIYLGEHYYNPTGIATDSQNNVYVTNGKYIQKFNSSGQLIQASGNGLWYPPDMSVFWPSGITIDLRNLVYVTDMDNACVHIFRLNGEYVTRWGEAGSDDGQFMYPSGIVSDASGDLYVTDQELHCVQKFRVGFSQGELSVQWVGRWGGFGKADGQFDMPKGVAADNGFIYVTDSRNDRIQKFTPDGQFVGKWGAEGNSDGEFYAPSGITVDSKGYVYVADTNKHRIQKFTTDGAFMDNWQSRGSDDGYFETPSGIDIAETASGDYLFVADKNNHRIQKFDTDGRHLSTWGENGEADGAFYIPYGVAANDQFVYVSDLGNHRIQKFDHNGGHLLSFGQSALNAPEGIDLDDDGNLYVADAGSHRIRVFSPDGLLLNEWDGTEAGDDKLYIPHGVLVMGDAVLVTDEKDRVRQFSLSGVHQQTWGSPGITGGSFNTPLGMTGDGGHLFVADSENHRIQRFSLSPTPAFDLSFGREGAGVGLFKSPTDLCMASDGRIFVTDRLNNRVQVFQPVTTPETMKAVVVAGGGPYPGNTLWDATRSAANFAVRALFHQGFGADRLRYLTADTQLDLDDDGDPDPVFAPTAQNLTEAVQWASDADVLVLYMVNHGGADKSGDGLFRLSETEFLSAPKLDARLDAYQNAGNSKVIMIYDACKSGLFIEDMLAPQGKVRTVITSTSADEEAYFISQGGNSFSGFFWTQIFNGLDIETAFASAQSALGEVTQLQNPLLDGDGDGSTNTPEDFQAVQGQYIGYGISQYSEKPELDDLSVSADHQNIFIEVTATDENRVARVWALIRSPEYDAAMGSVAGDHTLLDIPAVELKPLGNNRYRGIFDSAYAEGDYRLTLFARDREGNISDPSSVTVVSGSPLKRRAILVAGTGTDPSLVEMAYQALAFQGYGDSEIYLMTDAGTAYVADAAPSLYNAQYAITSWAAEDTLDLVIFLTGTGTDGAVRLNASENLTASQLHGWIDNVSTQIPGPVTVICEADYSGSFIPVLADGQHSRIIITSAPNDGPALHLSENSVTFSELFWKNILNGLTVGRAFSDTVSSLAFMTGASEERWPLLDDNGNGIGSELTDGATAAFYTIGAGIQLARNLPSIGDALPEIQTTGDNPVLLWASEVNLSGTLDRVWASVTPPQMVSGFDSSSSNLPPVEMTYQAATGRYEGYFSTLPNYGAYNAAVYAADTEGNLSVAKQTVVFRQDGPDVFEPDNTRTQANVITVGDIHAQDHSIHEKDDQDWMVFYGLEGETYTFQMDTIDDTFDISLTLFNETSQEILSVQTQADQKQINHDWACAQDGVYYLRVSLTDPETWTPTASYQIRIYRPLAPFTGFVKGSVINAATGAPVPLAALQTTANATGISRSNGRYLMIQEPGTYSVTIEAVGYEPLTTQITVGEGGTTFLDFQLTPLTTPQPPPVQNLLPLAAVISPTSDITVSSGQSVYFQGGMVGGNAPFAFSWDFDGAANNVYVQTPGDITFDTPGVYTITYTVTDADGDISRATVVVTVTDEDIDFGGVTLTVSPEGEIIAGEVVEFHAEIIGGNAPFAYFWDFGGADGNTTEENPGPVVFGSPGDYTVSLTVTDADGDMISGTINITVKEGPGTDAGPPAASIQSPESDLTIRRGDAVDFSAVVTGGSSPLSYAWDFSGGAENRAIPGLGDVVFDTPGTYPVTFTVTDAEGRFSTASLTIIVLEGESAFPPQPVIISPANLDTDVSLSPALEAETATVAQTRWMIADANGFGIPVMDIITFEHLFDITVPELILNPATTYDLRAQFIDENGMGSAWSETVSFTTLAEEPDGDSDGVADDREIDSTVDTDRNGVSDLLQPEMTCAATADGQKAVCVTETRNVSAIAFMTVMNPLDLSDPALIPEGMTYGFIGLRLETKTAGGTANMTLLLSAAVPSGTGWLAFDTVSGWRIFEKAVIAPDNRTVTLEISDGGIWDADGVPNGVIVLISGPGIPRLRSVSASWPGDDNVGGGGCFILIHKGNGE